MKPPPRIILYPFFNYQLFCDPAMCNNRDSLVLDTLTSWKPTVKLRCRRCPNSRGCPNACGLVEVKSVWKTTTKEKVQNPSVLDENYQSFKNKINAFNTYICFMVPKNMIPQTFFPTNKTGVFPCKKASSTALDPSSTWMEPTNTGQILRLYLGWLVSFVAWFLKQNLGPMLKVKKEPTKSTLPEANSSSHLKMDGRRWLPFGILPIFRGVNC